MNLVPRLDRLSALLEGLAPRVELLPLEQAGDSAPAAHGVAERFLYLYLVVQGRIEFGAASEKRRIAAAPAIVVCRSDQAHSVVVPSEGASDHVVCARAHFDGPVASFLLHEFGTPVVVPLDDVEPSLGLAIGLISSELGTPRCGQPALLKRAGDILFIGLLRHLIAHPSTPNGLFSGLADPRIARALVAMHARPQDDWTLERLADEAGMSRTAFANKFREVMNQPPGKYLAKLRLLIARRFVQSGYGLKRAAKESGYASPSALSRAMSRSVSLNA
jgi:AraC-like DNA-binding protein